jgi:hypothetical protein
MDALEKIGEFSLQLGYDCLKEGNSQYNGYCPCDAHIGVDIFLKGRPYCRCSPEYVMWLYAVWTETMTRIEFALRRCLYKDELTFEMKRQLERARLMEHHPQCDIMEKYKSSSITFVGEKRVLSPISAVFWAQITEKGIPEWNIPPPPWAMYKIYCDSI